MAIVLFLFLGELRSAIVVIVTLPLAMLIAFICMQRVGLSANLMSLAGLAIGIGMMVDGAVVMVENAFRLLVARDAASGKPINRTHVVLEAAREVANPIAFAILIIIVVFLPLFSLTGLEGKLFKPMALTITFAMAGSLLLTLTLVPVLCCADPASRRRRRTPGSCAAPSGCTCRCWTGRSSARRSSSAPRWRCSSARSRCSRSSARSSCRTLQEGAIMFRVVGIPSTSLDESIRVANVMDAALRKQFPQVNVGARHDRPRREGRDGRRQLHGGAARREAATTSGRRSSRIAALGRDDAGDLLEGEVPTVVFGATQPIQMRVEELISGVRATLALKIYGEDLDTLDELSAHSSRQCSPSVPGVADLSPEANKGKPQIVIKVDRPRPRRATA